MHLEPMAGCSGELRNPGQVIGSGNNRDVPHVHRKLGQIGLDIHPLLIPSQQRTDRKAVPLIPSAELPA